MGGLGFVLVIGLYIWLATTVVGVAWRRHWKFGVTALIALILLPTTDAVIGRLYLKHLCATEGGLHVNRVVNGVEGFFAGTTDEETLRYYGYTFIENSSHIIPRPDETVARIILQNGNAVKEDPVPPMAKYELISSRKRISAYFDQTSWIVRQRSDNSELGSYNVFTFRGGWIEWLLGGFADGRGSVAVCENIPFHGEKTVVQNTLIPKK